MLPFMAAIGLGLRADSKSQGRSGSSYLLIIASSAVMSCITSCIAERIDRNPDSLCNVLRCHFGAPHQADVAAMADLVIGCHEGILRFSCNWLRIWLCSASAWINLGFRVWILSDDPRNLNASLRGLAQVVLPLKGCFFIR
jgi:hypothetical protein